MTVIWQTGKDFKQYEYFNKSLYAEDLILNYIEFTELFF